MIAYSYESDDNDYTFVTTGCGCCSDQLYLSTDREEIIEQLKRNYRTLKDACEILDICLSDLEG